MLSRFSRSPGARGLVERQTPDPVECKASRAAPVLAAPHCISLAALGSKAQHCVSSGSRNGCERRLNCTHLSMTAHVVIQTEVDVSRAEVVPISETKSRVA